MQVNCNFRVDGYDIDYEKVLGQGEYGVVFECTSLNQSDMKEKLCVKVKFNTKIQLIDVRDQVSAVREASILNCLSSKAIFNQNVVKVKKVDYQQKKRMMCVVMEKCQTNLQQEWERKKTFSNQEVREFLRQIIVGYKTLHTNCIIHRDLKPENILINFVNDSPLYKLADFGVGKIYEENDFTLTKAKGTPAYAAPEINYLVQQKFGNIDEDLEADSAICWKDQSVVDIYSIGIILYQLLYGKLPFASNGEDIKLFFSQLKNNQFKPIVENNMDQELVQVIQEMIVYMPSRRISFEDLAQRFGNINRPILMASFHKKRNSLCDEFTQSTDSQSNSGTKILHTLSNLQSDIKKNNFIITHPQQFKQSSSIHGLNSPKECTPRFQLFPNQQIFSSRDNKPAFEQTYFILQNQEKELLLELKDNLQFLQRFMLNFRLQSSNCLNEQALLELQNCIQKLNSNDLNKFQVQIALSNLKSAFAYDPSKIYTNNYVRFLFLFTYFAYGKKFDESQINLSVEEQKKHLDQWKLTLKSQ